jgi:hypothetical protein
VNRDFPSPAGFGGICRSSMLRGRSGTVRRSRAPNPAPRSPRDKRHQRSSEPTQESCAGGYRRVARPQLGCRDRSHSEPDRPTREQLAFEQGRAPQAGPGKHDRGHRPRSATCERADREQWDEGLVDRGRKRSGPWPPGEREPQPAGHGQRPPAPGGSGHAGDGGPRGGKTDRAERRRHHSQRPGGAVARHQHDRDEGAGEKEYRPARVLGGEQRGGDERGQREPSDAR